MDTSFQRTPRLQCATKAAGAGDQTIFPGGLPTAQWGRGVSLTQERVSRRTRWGPEVEKVRATGPEGSSVEEGRERERERGEFGVFAM